METQDTTLKLHVDADGYVWHMAGDQMPVSSMLKVVDFMKLPIVTPADTVRLMGSQCNVDIILRLYERKLNGQLHDVQLCTPLACRGKARYAKADIVLMDILQWNGWPASLGGWHSFTSADFASYFLARNYRLGPDHPIQPEKVLKQHPAWYAINFIPNINMDACGRLLALLLDPRWYVDPTAPDKSTRMEGFLGLNPRIQFHVSQGQPPKKQVEMYDRCKLVMNVWKNDQPKNKDGYRDPRLFLWRVFGSEGMNYRGDLRASQMFITFLRNIWLHELHRARRSACFDGIFIPKYFFHTKQEIKAYEKYIGSQQEVVWS